MMTSSNLISALVAANAPRPRLDGSKCANAVKTIMLGGGSAAPCCAIP